MKQMLKVIVVDDEPLARRGMLVRLADFPELEIVAQCSNGEEAVAAIREHQPDAVFLDVEMPGLDGFGVLKQLQQLQIDLPYVVFVTAYDHYALSAFEVQAFGLCTQTGRKRAFGGSCCEAYEKLRSQRSSASQRTVGSCSSTADR